MGNDDMFVMELEIFEAELYSALVGYCLCVFTRAQTEEECNLDETGLASFKWGGVCSCGSLDDDAKGGCLFMFGWGILVGVAT